MPTPRHHRRSAAQAACQCLLSLVAVACTDHSAELSDALARAKQHLAARHYEPALAAFDEVLAIDPGHVDARGLKAEILLNVARLDEAAEILVGLQQELGPHDDVAWLLAMVRKDQRRFEEALELFASLPEARRPKLAMAEALIGTERYDDAADLTGEELVADPWNTTGYYLLSTIDLRRGREREGLLWGDHYRDQEPARAADRRARGMEYEGRALEAQLHRAESFYERELWHDAMAVLQEILKKNRRVASAFVLSGRILSDLGQSAAAIRAFEQALALQPGEPESSRLLDRERALQESAGGRTRTPLEMARGYVALGKTQRARAAALAVARQEPPDRAALQLVAELFDREEDAFVRLWAWRRMLAVAPGDASLRAAFGEQAEELGLRLNATPAGR